MNKKEYDKLYYLKNKKKKIKQAENYYKANKEKIKLYKLEWDKLNPDYAKLYQRNYQKRPYVKISVKLIKSKYNKEYYSKNKEDIKQASKQYRLNNPLKIKSIRQKYCSTQEFKSNKRKKEKALKANNLRYKIGCDLRTRIWMALDKSLKASCCEKLIGCTINELKIYLESQFKEEMTWDNWGKEGWHIDHIVPCASFDLSDKKQQEKCFHYSNLQPLWSTTEIALKHNSNSIGNLNKGKKVI